MVIFYLNTTGTAVVLQKNRLHPILFFGSTSKSSKVLWLCLRLTGFGTGASDSAFIKVKPTSTALADLWSLSLLFYCCPRILDYDSINSILGSGTVYFLFYTRPIFPEFNGICIIPPAVLASHAQGDPRER
jgi:hypothetical protein